MNGPDMLEQVLLFALAITLFTVFCLSLIPRSKNRAARTAARRRRYR